MNHKKPFNMIDKKFKHGDIYIISSLRNHMAAGIADIKFVGKYDKDISFSEAVEIHLKNMQRDFPSMNFNKEIIEAALSGKGNKKSRFFLNDRGEVQSYYNHEKADPIDLMFFRGDKPLQELIELKRKLIEKHNIKPDKDDYCRVWTIN